MKIYTKTGDDGTTGLFSGDRVSKDHVRIHAYGTVDELNSHIGLLISHVPSELNPFLTQIQNTLFSIGSHLATPKGSKFSVPPFDTGEIKKLEESMDEMDSSLEPLRNFILPQGSLAIGQCHVCRTTSRRSERIIVALSVKEDIDQALIHYINRLSDYFFMLSRYLHHIGNVSEIAWNSKA